MNNLYQVSETYLSSAWGKQQFDDALKIIQEVIEGSYAYTFSKTRQTNDIEGIKVFREGWERRDASPNFYSCLGSFSEPKDINFEMPTLTSVEGELKVKQELASSSWSTWHALEQLFGDDAFIFSKGRLMIKNKAKVQGDINRWQEEFSFLNMTHMQYVLITFYSEFDLARIDKSTPQQIEEWIGELEIFGENKRRWISGNESVPLFALGMTGYSKALKERKNARINFWRNWNINRFSLRKTDLISLPEWNEKYA